MITHRVFLSTVTNEFKSCRMRLGDDLRCPSVLPLHQERDVENQASGHSTLIKLDDLIKDCHSVIHLIGLQTSTDGRVAATENVDDLFTRYPELSATIGLTEAELRTLSYTQWEAWLAYYHIKKTNPNLKLVIATPASDFQPDNPPHAASARDQALSQAWHEKQLRTRCRYVEIKDFANAAELSNAILKALKDILPGQQPEQKIALSRLVSRHTGPESIGEFLGREDELKLLNEAWATPGTNVLSIIAWGGVGKTALLAEWIDRRFVQRAWKDDAGQPDPIFYFDWTFYDQGTRSDDATHAGAASVDSFFDAALRFFGDLEPHLPGKGGRLAGLIQKHRTLLVLDGLEPMQYPPNHPQSGQITDPDLHALLATLAQKNPGLCVLTSRQALTGLRRVDRHDLDELPEAIAIRLLQKLGVIGTEEDFAAAVRDYFGHALSLIVLGRFLFVKGGDIRLRDTIKLERANERRPETTTRNAWHVLEAYEQWLASPDGRAEDLQALRLTGLFDRPATPDCLDALRRAPAISGLTDQLVPLDDDAWNAVLHRLHEAHLIQLRYPPREPNSLAPRPEARQVPLDAHPLIREYFAKQLRDKHQAGYQQAHSLLFDHLCENTTPYEPDTLAGLQPLYQAVVHGCLAGRYEEAKDDVYVNRILRGTGNVGFYSERKLGAFGADLMVVAAFFEVPWNRVSRSFNISEESWLLNEASGKLRALGRLTEAQEPMRLAVEMQMRVGDFKNAAINAINLSELEIVLGKIREAVTNARRAIAFGDRAEDIFEGMSSRAAAADALHQSGERQEGRLLFGRAEMLQRQYNFHFALLYSLPGFQYCDLILADVEQASWRRVLTVTLPRLGIARPVESAFERVPLEQEVAMTQLEEPLANAERRVNKIFEWRRGPIWNPAVDSLLDIALDHLTFARCTLYRAILASPCPSELETQIPRNRTEKSQLVSALDGLRKANRTDFLPLGLLTAALHHHAIVGDAAAAWGYLDEAQQIAERGPMPLYLADVHLHRARLFHDKVELQRARALIEKHGYWRRKEELEDAEAAAVIW